MAQGYPVPIDKEKMVYAQTTERISYKKGVILARKVVRLARRNFVKAMKILEELVEGKRNIEGKYYTNTAKALLRIFKSVEANARFRGFDVNSLWIKSLSVNKGPTLHRRRRKREFGTRLKIAHIKLVVEKK